MSEVNKVIFAGAVLLDLTSDTVTEDVIIDGYVGHDAAGNKITGKLKIITVDEALDANSTNPLQNKAIVSALNGKLSTTGNAASATKLDSSDGNATKPVYFSDGKPVACTYSLNADVPSNAVFTDTKYTLPEATSSILGGVKVGSNISVSNGTISVSKTNVTDALGYTPLQTAPVTSVNGSTGAVTVDSLPAGTIIAFGGTSAPSGFLSCSGANVSRTTYAKLFSAIGTTYGTGDGSTTFTLPNLSTSLVSAITTGNVPVFGNGMTIGYVGSNNATFGLTTASNHATPYSGLYGTNVGTGVSGSHVSGSYGLTTDSAKSGIVAKVTATKTTVKYCIKY